MAKYFTHALTVLIFTFSIYSWSVVAIETDPSLEIIKHEDAEEGYNYPVIETLLCDDSKSPDNTVQTIEGDPPHLYSEVKVTCLPGMHFTGQPLNVTMVTVKCLPLPHPCMCMAAWETRDDFMLMYDFNCTSDDQTDSRRDDSGDVAIYPYSTSVPEPPTHNDNVPHELQNVDDDHSVEIQAHPDTPEQNIEETIDDLTPGVSQTAPEQPNETEAEVPEHLKDSEKEIAQESTSITEELPEETKNDVLEHPAKHETGVEESSENPDTETVEHLEDTKIEEPEEDLDGTFYVKDGTQCPDPTPINATLKVVSGTPYTDGCNVLLTCDPGLKFPDGKTVWNITCVPLPVMPPKLIWIPQFGGQPTCKGFSEEPETNGEEHHEEHETEVEENSNGSEVDTEDHLEEPDTEEQEEGPDRNFHENYDLQCPDPTPINATLKVVSGTPYTDGCNVLLTCDPGLKFPDGKTVWNITCVPLSTIPPRLIWKPQFVGQPTCKANDNTIPLETIEVEGTGTEEIDTSMESSEEETNVISEHVSNEEEQNTRSGDNVEETVDTNEIEVNHENENTYDTVNEQISEEFQEQSENDSKYENIQENEHEEELEEEIPELANNVENEEHELLDANLQVLDKDVPNNQEYEATERSEQENENEKNSYTEEEEHEDGHGEIGENEEDAIGKEGTYEVENEQHENNDLEEESNRSANSEDNVERVPDVEEIIFSNPFVSEPDQIRGHKWIYNAIEEFAKGAEQTTEEGIVGGDGEENVVAPRPLYEMQSAPPKKFNDETEYIQENRICSLPAKTGFCKAHIQRYFYNSDSKECQMFIYGGCGGNENNFETIEGCWLACVTDKFL